MMWKKIGRLFVIKTRFEACLIIYALAVGAMARGSAYLHEYPGIGGKVRPVVYADFQANARTNWNVAQSIMGGLQFENARIGDRKLQVLAEYFSGPSPDGQLFTQKVEWIGMGVHLWF